MIPDLTIGNLMIDCTDASRAREFYADLLGWERTILFDYLGVKTDNDMPILFVEPDIPYIPPVWPEESGRQQKQMYFNFQVVDLLFAVVEAIRLGSRIAAKQYGGGKQCGHLTQR